MEGISMRWLGLLVVALIAAGSAQAACSVQKRAEVTLDEAGGVPLVPLTVDGHPASFILDTGAQRSLVTSDAAGRLGLVRDEWVATTMRGVGGVERNRNADPRSLELGGAALRRRTMAHDNTLAVGTIPRDMIAGRRIDGLLGRDLLSVFDLDLDVPARRLALYQVEGCAGRFLPWTVGYSAVPVRNPAESALVVPVELDGHPLQALLDTGAGSTLLAAPGIAKLGLEPVDFTSDTASAISGLGPRTVAARRHRFARLRVGSETVRQPWIWVAPIRLYPITDMLLGADWLTARRVWISYATRQIFIAS